MDHESVCIDGKMDFPPGASLANPMLPYLPFSFAIDLRPVESRARFRGPFEAIGSRVISNL